jgi:3',5'-cyclic AMP phosphodiesterase CpdA
MGELYPQGSFALHGQTTFRAHRSRRRFAARALGLVRSGAALLCLVSAAAGATLVRAPYLQNVQAGRASILWTTDAPGVGVVSISDGHSATSATAQIRAFLPAETMLATAFYQYQADLTGLTPGTAYTYSVALNGQTLASSAADGSPLHFTTEGPGRFSFLVLGDSGERTPEQTQIASLLSAEPDVALLLHMGDLACDLGTFAQLDSNYFAPYADLMQRVPFFPAPGNHEYYTNRAAPYLSAHASPDSGVPAPDQGRYYSFDWGDAHFTSLDSNLLGTASEVQMLAWFDHDLQASRKLWKIVYFHHTPYPSGHHLGDPACERALAVINPIAERNGVQLVLSGHEHSYQRSVPLSNGRPALRGGTTYIISAGGGQALQNIGQLPTTAAAMAVHNYLRVDLDGSRLTIRVIGLGGAWLDQVVLDAAPARKRVVAPPALR